MFGFSLSWSYRRIILNGKVFVYICVKQWNTNYILWINVLFFVFVSSKFMFTYLTLFFIYAMIVIHGKKKKKKNSYWIINHPPLMNVTSWYISWNISRIYSSIRPFICNGSFGYSKQERRCWSFYCQIHPWWWWSNHASTGISFGMFQSCKRRWWSLYFGRGTKTGFGRSGTPFWQYPNDNVWFWTLFHLENQWYVLTNVNACSLVRTT